jgi:hypothetical protein
MPFLQRSKMLLLATTVVGVVVVVTKKESLRELVSSLCEYLTDSVLDIESDLSRDAFAANNVEQVVPTPGHTHANAAALRTAATNFASNVAQHCGSEVYVVGMSKSDQRKDMKGSRQWYWAKDVNADNRHDPPSPHDIRYLCDVDYYVNMPDLLISEAKPVLLYTVVPEEANSNGEQDTSFTFDDSGALVTHVAGGGTYSHHLWDYSADCFLVTRKFLGIPYRVIPYAVERKQVAKHRQVVLLAPIRHFWGWSALLAYFLLEPKELKRFDPVVKAKDGSKFIRFHVQTKNGLHITTSRPMSHLCATVSASVDDSIATVSRLGSTNLMLPTTASWLKDNRPAAAVLTEYFRLCGAAKHPYVYPVELGVRAYQYKPSEFDQEAKPKLQGFMSPLVHESFAPVLNKAGEEQCVKGRITDLRKEEPRPSRFRDRCIDEFANLVVQGVHLEPVCVEAVKAKQTSATQVLSLLAAFVMGPHRMAILKCFGKAEPYPGLKDPRNISMYNHGDKLDMAMFSLAMADHCKQFKWYGPGKTPIEVAERVAEICSDAEYVNVSDYHRMDGTITYTLRRVERAVLMKAFGNHRTKLNELLKTNVDNKSILPLGTTFDQGSSHGSGCSATSLFQTLRAAFTAYLAFRNKTHPGGRPYTPKEAFDALGIHLGDDGLDADLPEQCHSWAANKVGLVLEAKMVQRGFRGVNFLARYYSPEVWEGCLDSMCDASRQISKFHVTVRLPANVTPEQKLVEKAMSYVATDGNTPVLGKFCKRVLVLSNYRPKSLLGVGSWWSKFDGSVQYPNQNVGGWMDVEFAESLPEFDRHLFDQWLDKSESIKDLLSAPLCCEPKRPAPASVDVVVDEDVVEASVPPPSETSENRKKRVRPRRGPKPDARKGTVKSKASGKSRK